MGIQINGQTDTVASTTSGGSVTLPSATLPAVSNISATRVNVTGVSTFTSGPVLIGSGTSTGTASQTLQVTGGTYISGNLGIGTTNPQERVHFYSPTSTNFIRLDNGSSATSYYGLNSSGDVEINAATNNNLIFKTFGTERGRIDSSGNVGLGTLNATRKLDVVGDVRVTGILTAAQYNITTHVPIQNVTFNTATSNGTVSGSFAISVKSNCLFSFNGTAYKASGNIINMTLSITGVGNLTSISYYTNETSSHKASPTGYVTTTLNAGTYTVVITCDSNTDTNDRGNCSVLAIPTL
jgi:hypothetical protein